MSIAESYVDKNPNTVEKFQSYTRVGRYFPECRRIAFYMVAGKWVGCSCGYGWPYEIDDSGELYCSACDKCTQLSEILGETK